MDLEKIVLGTRESAQGNHRLDLIDGTFSSAKYLAVKEGHTPHMVVIASDTACLRFWKFTHNSLPRISKLGENCMTNLVTKTFLKAPSLIISIFVLGQGLGN